MFLKKRSVQDSIDLPTGASESIRHHLGIRETVSPRISFIAGPGDVTGTFTYWRKSEHDPRVPVIAYSLMFYELVQQLDCVSQILSFSPAKGTQEESVAKFYFGNVRQKSYNGRWGYFLSQRAYARDIVRKVNEFDPHVVIASTGTPPMCWKQLARGRKLILSMHNAFWPMDRPPRGLKDRFRHALLSSHAANIDSAICTSHECARQLAKVTGNRIKAEVEIPQIVARYPIVRRDRARKLIFLGRIEANKGVFFLVDVVERLMQRFPDLTLELAGSGSAEDDLKTRIGVSPVASRLRFLGHLSSESVHAKLASSDLLVCPTMSSCSEGLAVVGLEAAAHGIPSILSSVVPASDLLGGSCSVFKADDASSLENVLVRFLIDDHAYRVCCDQTGEVREQLYDPALSWGSGLFRALMSA